MARSNDDDAVDDEPRGSGHTWIVDGCNSDTQCTGSLQHVQSWLKTAGTTTTPTKTSISVPMADLVKHKYHRKSNSGSAAYLILLVALTMY